MNVETKLEPCPVCGESVTYYPKGSIIGFDPLAIICDERACPYHLQTGLVRTDAAALIEVHNALARRAEIGRLVEAIVDGPDAEWRAANAPKLEELRARYPGAMVEITPLHVPGDDYLARLVTESVSVEHAAPTVGHALEWLAAKLAELEESTDGT